MQQRGAAGSKKKNICTHTVIIGKTKLFYLQSITGLLALWQVERYAPNDYFMCMGVCVCVLELYMILPILKTFRISCRWNPSQGTRVQPLLRWNSIFINKHQRLPLRVQVWALRIYSGRLSHPQCRILAGHTQPGHVCLWIMHFVRRCPCILPDGIAAGGISPGLHFSPQLVIKHPYLVFLTSRWHHFPGDEWW